ncbi:uncharacterized protein LTR77_009256 [Saxophila tyrrhenica]|uniref:Uncharacterized protein n=1 Tax=Saxophila tyrrhenica TaxID=1690608 RepID=A0AAV9P2G8_9PEZI|nr:hypothetical protein LTR77_009256 [Saxophila tyrrhenica]
MDILLAVPRFAQRAGHFALGHMPEAVDNIAGKIFNGGSVIADATGQQTINSTITNTSNDLAQATNFVLNPELVESWFKEGAEDATSSMFGMILQGMKKMGSMGGMFSYLTSRWALATFTAAIILNRTQFYASSRESLRLPWYVRLALYVVPICVFLAHLQIMLEALRCQTSPDFALLRYGDPLKNLAIDFGAEGGFLYKLSSTLTPWQNDMESCTRRGMSLPAIDNDRSLLRGSMSLLFGFFLSLCTYQLFETLSCSLQGERTRPETGMTLFEHSLAFAECEAMISSALGFGFFGQLRLDGASSARAEESNGPMVSRAELLQRLNVPPEVLLVCVISCLSHLSSSILAVTGLRHKVRLVNTGIWASCYMTAFVWSFAKVIVNPIDNIADLGVLRFPTVCIVGFIPHLLILIGIMTCAVIYAVALLVTTLSVPAEVGNGMSFRERFAWAYENLQANVQFSPGSRIQIRMSDDFYNTLLKVGFAVLTAASEAVYLNEGNRIKVAQMTWLEQKRIDELASSMDERKKLAVPSELLDEDIARGLEFTDHHNHAISTSPYARERKSKPKKGDAEKPSANEPDSGLGLANRRNRMQLTADFIAGMFWLIVGIQANIVLGALRKTGIAYQPSWLLKAAGVGERQRRPSNPIPDSRQSERAFKMLDDQGRLVLPLDRLIDVEQETRKRLQREGTYAGEESLSETLYNWWGKGGWFGDLDQSDDYQASNIDDDDTTSMISMSTNASTDDDWSDMSDSGRRTPTQLDPHGDRSYEPTSEPEGLSHLARLLNPQSPDDREEARLLSHTLQSNRPMTRSQYRRDTDRIRAQLLAGLRAQPAQPLTDEEEERDLEHFILERRSKAGTQARQSGTWESGAEVRGLPEHAANNIGLAVWMLEYV